MSKNKQENIEISVEHYNHLIRLANYVHDWYPNYTVCGKCGAYHPDGYICINCAENDSAKK